MDAILSKPRLNLTNIRGFDAAARHLSFTAAAQDLNVTQGAISRQIASLEEDLGVALFKRMTRRIELTDEGARFHQSVAAAFLTLERGVESISPLRQAQTLTVSVLPTVGSVWLMPRLHRFTHANPGIDVRIVTSIDPADVVKGGIDVAIRVGPLPDRAYAPLAPRIDLRMATQWAGVEARELFPDTLVPVLSKRLHSAHKGLSLVDLLESVPLIHTSTRRHGWPDWLRAHGLDVRPTGPLLEFGHFFMALEEARAGRGIALVPSVVLPNLDYRKSLHFIRDVVPVTSAGAYYALSAVSRSADPVLRTFTSWIAAEANTHRTRIRSLA